MKNLPLHYLLLLSGFLLRFAPISAAAAVPNGKPWNILFLTTDDMNWDSVGCYGSTVEDISPHIDSLAMEGIRFQHAYVQTPVCTPSRNVLHTGRYPHQSGVQGFYSVNFPGKTLPERLKDAGYFTGILQKVPDSTPCNTYAKYWNFQRELPKATYRNPQAYAAAFDEILQAAETQGKPFYANINVIDPHLPFFNGPKTREGEWDLTAPSRIYEPEEVPIPGFLPQNDAFAQEVADYYSTMKRGDDCVGTILQVLENRGVRENTIIIFMSDHGMSFPFAKENLTPAGVRAPWIVVWPGQVEKGALDTEHMISAIDLMPTVLDMVGLAPEPGTEGRSILPLLKGNAEPGRDRVFVQLNENPNADVRPMRAIYTPDFVYIFNPWSNGTREALMESRWYRSYATFAKLAAGDEAVRERFEFLKHRTVEELYAYNDDPHARNNLIRNPAYQLLAEQLREELMDWMVEKGDYVSSVFPHREDPEALEAFMAEEDRKALERSPVIQWKRWRNRSGTTGDRTQLFDPPALR